MASRLTSGEATRHVPPILSQDTVMKPDVILAMPLHLPVQQRLEAEFTVHRMWEAPDKPGFLAALRERVTAFATFAVPVTAALMDALPRLKIVSTMTIGVDHIDVAAARARGIAVTNTPDVLTDDVADCAIALVLAVARRIVVADRYVRSGGWRNGAMPLATKVGGSTMGIVGLGRIGSAIARRGVALGMTVVYHGPRRKPDVPYPFYADLVAMARDVDYLVVASPGGAATRHLVDAAVLAALGPEGVVINIGRGTVIDEAAMVDALQRGAIGGAGLDVFENEPHVPEALCALDNVVLLPHVGSATEATRRAMGDLMIDNLAAYFAGRPLLTPVP
jgi:lactate dehydrogenase-like 2-hydroxyacid dehydrogenase